MCPFNRGGEYNRSLRLYCSNISILDDDGLYSKPGTSVTVRSSIPNPEIPLQVHLAPEIPSYKTGYALLSPNITHLASEKYIRGVINDYASGRPVYSIKGCPTRCSARVWAPALAVDKCISTLQYINFSQPLTPEQNAT